MIVVAVPGRNSTVGRLARARELLHNGLDEKLTVEQVARAAAWSPGQFNRTYKAVFGQTPQQTRIAARLELAKRLLITHAMDVTDICAAAGFASLGTFSYVFTQRVGVSPSAFRRQARALIQVPGLLPARLYPGCFTLMAFWPATPNRSI